MYQDDLALLICPKTGGDLALRDVTSRADDGEILEAVLSGPDGHTYPIRNGIPRFIESAEYNPTWDFKWRELDGGRGLNYRIIDKSDLAYQIHDLFDRNGYGGEVYERARGRIAMDIGCGIGQYSVRLLQEFEPSKLISFDLTGAVDIFRKQVIERYPELKRRLLIVQANVFEMPFRPQSVSFAMSLGVLHHTGDTKRALQNVIGLLEPHGHINFWVYCSENVAYSVTESDRGFVYDMTNIQPIQKRYQRVQWWLRQFRHRVPHEWTVRTLRAVSSDFVYDLSKRRGFRFIRRWFPMVEHPDAEYRLINMYDGYVNKWSDSWSEKELFPVLKDNGVVIRGLADWRLGIWGVKQPEFYAKT